MKAISRTTGGRRILLNKPSRSVGRARAVRDALIDLAGITGVRANLFATPVSQSVITVRRFLANQDLGDWVHGSP